MEKDNGEIDDEETEGLEEDEVEENEVEENEVEVEEPTLEEEPQPKQNAERIVYTSTGPKIMVNGRLEPANLD